MVNKHESSSLDGLTDIEIAELVRANEDLDAEKERIIKEDLEEQNRKRLLKQIKNNPFIRLRKSPIEIINRTLFFIFLGCFIYSFISLYYLNLIWFFLYSISAFSCILYTPNRKALKELIDAWQNILTSIEKRKI